MKTIVITAPGHKLRETFLHNFWFEGCLDIDDLKKEVARLSWYHTIDLGHGVVTPGFDNSPARLRKLGLSVFSVEN